MLEQRRRIINSTAAWNILQNLNSDSSDGGDLSEDTDDSDSSWVHEDISSSS